MFLLHFRDLRRFYFLDIQKLKYAAAYFAYTQARPWMLLLSLNRAWIQKFYQTKPNLTLTYFLDEWSEESKYH